MKKNEVFDPLFNTQTKGHLVIAKFKFALATMAGTMIWTSLSQMKAF